MLSSQEASPRLAVLHANCRRGQLHRGWKYSQLAAAVTDWLGGGSLFSPLSSSSFLSSPSSPVPPIILLPFAQFPLLMCTVLAFEPHLIKT